MPKSTPPTTFKPTSSKVKASSSTATKPGLKAKSKSLFLAKPKLLYIADSVGHSAAIRKVEISQNCRVRIGRAYSSVHNVNARWPERNFKDIVNYALKHPGRENFDVLVMSAPTVDITNLNTSNLQTSENSMFFQQQACLSSQNMFQLAEKSLQNNLSLSKVVIMEHPPRFDTPDVDPTSLKPKLARLANSTLGQLWLNSPLKDKIHIGRHSLESTGAGATHFKRYENNKTGRYDGVHMYGQTGCKDYTNSLKTILMMALAEQPMADFGVGTALGGHNDCEQAKHQKKHYQPHVQTSNRFSLLNQGNF